MDTQAPHVQVVKSSRTRLEAPTRQCPSKTPRGSLVLQYPRHLAKEKPLTFGSGEVLNGWAEKKVRWRRASYMDLHSEVVHRVLYPKAHGNGFKKKKTLCTTKLVKKNK